jgi:hypothetical protein
MENTAPDLPPVPGQQPAAGRDHKYILHGTLTLLAGIDLWNGEVLGLVPDRHRSAESIEFLRLAEAHYPVEAHIRMVLDNHSAHISRETRAYLGTIPNRFEFHPRLVAESDRILLRESAQDLAPCGTGQVQRRTESLH